MVTKIKGAKGAKGKNGANPTAGGNGDDASFTQNGQITMASLAVEVTGGDGGLGGNRTGAGAGAAGGNGGNASGTFNGNIINGNSVPNNLTVSITATGGDGGLGGTGTTNGPQGNGGNATVTMNGNIIQPSKNMNNIELDAIAVGGFGTKYGNASATLSGNIVQPTKANSVTLRAQAYSGGVDPFANNGNASFGTKTATLTGNIVQGNVNNVSLYADTYNPATPFQGANGTATLSGNIVQTNAANTGTVTLEASGQHIDIQKNKITLGKQELDLTVATFGPTYDVKIKGNEFTGTGTNTFVFSDVAYPGPRPTPDTIAIDLNAETFVFNGDNNKLKSFANATVVSDNDSTITGSNGINILVGGSGNDLLTGGKGNDQIDGGAGLFDTAVYTGNFAQYSITPPVPGPNLAITVQDNTANRDGTDTLTNVEFLKFADGLYDVANHQFISNNHAPVANNDTYTFNEDQMGNVGPLAGVLFNDTDAENDPLTATIVANATHGTVTLSPNGAFTYTPDADYNGTDSFTYKANDGTSDSNVATVTINVTSVNDAPAGADHITNILEDASYVFTAADFGFTDPQDAPSNHGADAFLAVKISTLPANGSLTLNGNPVAPGDFVPVTEITAGHLVFTPAANGNGAGYGNFTFQVQDNGGVANGGVDLDQSANTFTINVTAVNDAPAGTDKTVNSLEDTPYAFTVADFGFTDPNDIPVNTLLAVTITTLPANGSLTLNGNAVTAGDSVLASEIAAGHLVFTPAANANGAGYGNFTFQVQDNGGVANGGLDLDQTPNTITLNVTAVNDAPAGADKTISDPINTPYVFTVADFGFTDPNDTPPNAFAGIQISTLPAAGTLYLNGNPITVAGGFVTAGDIAAGHLTFVPALNGSGPNYASFNFQVKDDGGVAFGGVDLDQSPNTITFNITNPGSTFTGTPGNDPITGTPGDDTFYMTAGDDTLDGAAGSDTLLFTNTPVPSGPVTVDLSNPAPQAIGGGFGTDTLTNFENVDASAIGVNATLTGNAADNVLTGGSGDDLLIATTGHDSLIGNGNTVIGDTADFRNFAGGVTVDLSVAGAQNLGGGNTVTLSSIENLAGGAGNDTLTGDAGDNTLIATAGNDTLNGGANTVVGDTADFRNFAGGVTIDLGAAGPQSLGGGNNVTLQNIENLAGGAGNDTFTDKAGANNTYSGAGGIDTVTFGTPLSATTIAWTGSNFTVTGANGTDTTNVEVLQGSSGPRTLLVGGPGGFATINAAIAAANAGDTILIAPGTYNENVVVNVANLTLMGAGPGVIIEGTFTEDQTGTQPTGSLATWLQTRTQAQGYSGASGTGINVAANGVTLKNLTVDDFLNAVSVSGPSVSGLTLDGVTTQHSVFGFTKPDGTALNGTTITGSTFQDEYIGAGFFNDVVGSQDATNTTITNTTFTHIDAKGVYMETAQGNTNLTNLTMNDVGAFGRVPTFGNPPGVDGNGIDLNLKFHTYTGNVDISGFNLTNVGGSAGQSGAIVVEGRDDAPSYSGNPADVSGLTVNIHDGAIDGTSTGIRAGEIKPNPAQNVTGPATNITNVTITNATVGDIDNHTNAAANTLMTVTGTNGNDHYVAAQLPGSLGPITINGVDGDDTLGGGGGNDTINGGAGNDLIYASNGSDVLTGGANSDTVDFSLLTAGVNISLANTGFQSLGALGQVKLATIENLNGSNFNDVLSGSTGNNIINGNDGDDTFLLSGGKDTFDGGNGNDTVDLSSLAAGVTINLGSAAAQNVGGTDTIKLSNIENLIGTGFDDTLKGDGNNNILIGGAGNDTMTGGGGTLDIFYGGANDDNITGSAGTTVDVAYYTGLETGHTIVNPNNLGNNNIANTVTVSGGADGTDTLIRMDRLKFLSPSHVTDLDNNGMGDLVYQDSATGQITYVAHPGTVSKTLTNNPGASWNVIGTGQFTPDANGVSARKSGILVQDSGTRDMQLITGIAGVNSTVTALSSASGTFAGWTAITTGDFNGDAASDILLQNDATGAVEIAFLNGVKNAAVGTVDSIQSVATPAGANWKVVAAGDFDADGHSDILFRDTTNNNIVVDLMRGNTIESTASFAPGATLTAIATGDFNGDGNSDILFQKNDGNAVIWTMNGATQTGTIAVNTNPGAGFVLAGAEDINGDGVSDLIWHNDGALSGETQATLMTTGGVVGATSQIGIAPPNTLRLIASTGGG